MHFLRKSGVRISTALLSLVIFLGIITLSLNLAFGKADNIKQWIKQSNIYNAVVPAIINTTDKQPNSQDQAASDNAFTKPEVQKALQESFTPEFIQASTEKIIDGTYNWLEGKTPKPDYAIDLSAPKKAFADKLGLSAQQRIVSLPACSVVNPPTSTDPFSINCQPSAAVSNVQIQKYVNEVANSKDFLPETTITADTTSLNPTNQAPAAPTQSTTPQVSWYQQETFKKGPEIYKWIILTPYICGGLALLFILTVVFGSNSKREGLKTIAGSLISAGFLVGIGAALTLFVFNKLQFTAGQQDAGGLQKPLLDVLKTISDSISKTQLYWGIGLVVAGIVLLIALWAIRPKSSAKSENDKETAQPSKEENPKPIEQKSEEPVKETEQPVENPETKPE